MTRTDDRGLAALAEALDEIVENVRFGERFSGALMVDKESTGELAAAILGERAVFWPTGTEEYRELIHQYQAEIERWQAALNEIVAMERYVTSPTRLDLMVTLGRALDVAKTALRQPEAPVALAAVRAEYPR